MVSEFQIAYVPIGVPTFHLESAKGEFEKSKALLKSFGSPVITPEKMLLSLGELAVFLDRVRPDLIILQNVTFANAAYASEVLRRFSCPVALWTLREPVIDGGRLRLNSLTGAYSAANMLKAFRREPFPYVFGSPEETRVREYLKAVVDAARVKKMLTGLRIASVGHTPDGFGFGRALDAELLQIFGVILEQIETRELIERAKGYDAGEAEVYLQKAEEKVCGLAAIPENNRLDFARLYKAYEDYVRERGIGALSSRCWPDYFTSYGTPVCAVLALLNDMGVAASCEADTYGALSMYIGMQFSGMPVFFGDPASLDERENTITYWHCGMAPCSLAREDTGAVAGVHCNRKIGPTMDFGCRACPHVTVFRIGRKPDGTFRFFILEGEALDRPRQFTGTTVVVKTERPVLDIVEQSVQEGLEPHFCVIYGDCARELKLLAGMLGIEIYLG